MNQNELFNYDFTSVSEVLDRCKAIKESIKNAEDAEDVFFLIDAINEWYPGLKKTWIPQMTPNQKELCIKLFKETDNIANARKKYFSRKSGRNGFSDEELDDFKAGCISHISECSSFNQWCYWFEEKMNSMFGEEWLYGKNSSVGVKCYSVCFAKAKKHFKVYEFAPRPQVSLEEFQTYFPQWMKDARQFKPNSPQEQYDYFYARAVERLQETFGRNFTSYDKRYYKSATEVLDLAKRTAANEFLSPDEVTQMFPQPEKMFDTYEECKQHFIEAICDVCRVSKVDTDQRLNQLIRFFMHSKQYRWYSENDVYIQYASDLYETAFKEGKKIVESVAESLPF